MFKLLNKLTSIDAVSGNEKSVSDFIISEIDGFCEWRKDALGNIIAFKKGKNRSAVKLMVDAHTDEVGLIITDITADGYLKFKTVGGINTEVLFSRRVRINGSIIGVIGSKPIHLLKDNASKLPSAESLYIDIGARDKKSAEELIFVGDRAVLLDTYCETENTILSKALDDRVGCAILITLLKEDCDYDFYATFTVQEELGLRGAKTAAYAVNPHAAIVLEGTTAADIADVPDDKQVCKLGDGVAVSFMDRATVYDRDYYNAALNSGIACQTKCAVAGGNNSGAIHTNREGVRTISLSVPCRYIHSASSVCDKRDIESAYKLAKYMINSICGGNIK